MSDYVHYWNRDSVEETGHDEAITGPGSNQYGKLQPGDRVWVVAMDDDGLHLFAKIGVREVLPEKEAKRKFDDLWPAEWHVRATDDSRTAKCRIPFGETAAALEFTGGKKSIDGEPSWIHFWSLRQVTSDSAARIESLWRKYESLEAHSE